MNKVKNYLLITMYALIGFFFNIYEIISRGTKLMYNLVPFVSVFCLLLFLIMWETSARYICVLL